MASSTTLARINSSAILQIPESKEDCCESMEQRTWDTLLPPLLEMILERLPVPDYLRFPAVCSSWRDVQWDHRCRFASSPRHERQKPWIMFQYYLEDQIMLFNPSEQRYYRFPNSSQRYFCGCSHGWLFLLDDYTKELYFLNPFTESEITIPPINEWIKSSGKFPSIVILSSVPTDPGCIFLLGKQTGELYCLINGDSWRQIRIMDVEDYWPTFAISGGKSAISRDKFYILDKLRGSVKINLILVEFFPVLSNRIIEMDCSFLKPPEGRQYLMESDGDLLMAIQDRKNGAPQIGVFKADLSHNAWVMLESLNDRVLFLRSGQSFSLSAVGTKGPGNRINCEGPMGFEYDYKTHLVIMKTNLPSLKPNHYYGRLNSGPTWIVPNLERI